MPPARLAGALPLGAGRGAPSSLARCRLRYAQAQAADFTDAVMDESDLSGADFTGALMLGVSLREANVTTVVGLDLGVDI